MIPSVKKLSLKSIWALLWMACVFLYIPFVSDAGYLPKSMGFSLITLFGLIFFWRSLKLNLSHNYGVVLLGLIIVFSLPSVFISANLGDALLTITRWALVILLVSMFSIKMDTSNLKAFTIKSTSLVLLTLSLWGMQEWFFALEDFVLTHKATYNVTASLGHRNLYIQYLVLLMPFAAAGLFSKGWWQKVSMASVGLSLFLVIVLLNRTAWFTVAIYAVSALLIFAFLKQGSLIRRKKELIALSGFLGISLIIALLLVDEVYTFAHQFETVFDFSKGTSRDRFLLAQRSFSLFLDHPFIGVGSGMWKIHIMGFSQEGMLTTSANLFYQRPHNDYLWILSESGLFAGVLFMALHLLGFVRSIKHWMKRRTFFDFAVVMSWTGLFIASITSFPIERPEYLLILALLLIFSFGGGKDQTKTSWRPVLIGLNLFVMFVLLIRFVGELDYMKGKQAQSDEQWESSEFYMTSAQSVFFQVDALSLPLTHHKALAQFQLGQKDKAAVGFKKALTINPFHPETWNNLGICAFEKNDLDSALQCFKNAVRYTESYQDAWLNISIIQYNQGNWRTSFRSFLRADSALGNNNYRQLGTLLSIDSLNRIISQVRDRKMMKTLEAFRNTPKWSFSIIQKCASNDIPFDHQAYIDACFFMLKHCEEYEDCDLVDEIIIKYFPGGKADLNLLEE